MQRYALKSKILNLLLVVTSLLGYLEWGAGSRAFLFQAEADLVSNLMTDFAAAIHPFTILPLAGQMVLLATLFQKLPGKILTITGMSGLGVLLAFMFVIGLLSLNFKIALSTVPFLTVVLLTVKHLRTGSRVNRVGK